MDKAAIFLQLDRIFSHELFKSSKRSVSFLQYVCRQTLEGKVEQIKEYSIAVEAFGLDHNFDQQLNPRIRVEAKRLRDRLSRYYESDGKEDEIIISLPKGTYIPEFRHNQKRKPLRSETRTSPGKEVDFLFDFGEYMLGLSIHKHPETLFNKWDYLMTGLLRNLFIRSEQEPASDLERKKRILGQITYTFENDEPRINVLLPERNASENIRSRTFPLPDSTDIPQYEKMIFQLADYLITHCQTD